MSAKEGTGLSTDSVCASHPALGLHSAPRTVFRNHSINVRKGCISSLATLRQAQAPLKLTGFHCGPCWGKAAPVSPPCQLPLPCTYTQQHIGSASSSLPCLCQAPAAPALTTASTARHGMARYNMVRRSMVPGNGCCSLQSFPPHSLPSSPSALAASTSLPESKGKLFLQPYLAALATNIPRDTKFFLGCSPVI